MDTSELEEVECPGGGAGLGHLAPGEGVGPRPVDVHPVDPPEEAPLLRHEAQVPHGARHLGARLPVQTILPTRGLKQN